MPGTAVFLNRGQATTPLAMRANVEHNQVLHQHVVVVAIETLPIPHAEPGGRIAIDDFGVPYDGIYFVGAAFGYKDQPDVPRLLAKAVDAGLPCPLGYDDVSYFLSTIELRPGDEAGMERWRKRLFVATSHITADAAEYFSLPRERTVIVGSVIDV